MSGIDPQRVIRFMAAEAANDRERIATLLAENEHLNQQVQALRNRILKQDNKPIQIARTSQVIE